MKKPLSKVLCDLGLFDPSPLSHCGSVEKSIARSTAPGNGPKGGTTGMKDPVVIHGSYESYSSSVYYIIYVYHISLDFNRFHDISITRDLDGFDGSLTCIFLGQLLNWKPQVVWSRLSISSWRFQPILKTWQSIGIIISSLGFDQKILKTTQLIRYSCNSV